MSPGLASNGLGTIWSSDLTVFQVCPWTATVSLSSRHTPVLPAGASLNWVSSTKRNRVWSLCAQNSFSPIVRSPSLLPNPPAHLLPICPSPPREHSFLWIPLPPEDQNFNTGRGDFYTSPCVGSGEDMRRVDWREIKGPVRAQSFDSGSSTET